MPAELNSLGIFGVAGAIVAVVWFFIGYQREDRTANIAERTAREEANRLAIKLICDGFTNSVHEGRAESRETIDALLAINKETVVATNAMSAAVAENTRRLSEQAQLLEQVRQRIAEIECHADGTPLRNPRRERS